MNMPIPYSNNTSLVPYSDKDKKPQGKFIIKYQNSEFFEGIISIDRCFNTIESAKEYMKTKFIEDLENIFEFKILDVDSIRSAIRNSKNIFFPIDSIEYIVLSEYFYQYRLIKHDMMLHSHNIRFTSDVNKPETIIGTLYIQELTDD